MRRVSEGTSHPPIVDGGEYVMPRIAPKYPHRRETPTYATPQGNTTRHHSNDVSPLSPSQGKPSGKPPKPGSGQVQSPPEENQQPPCPALPRHDAYPKELTPPAAAADSTDHSAQSRAYDSAHFVETGYSLRGRRATAEPDPAHGAILIYPKKIDNLRRFRILFVGLLLFISSSTQGMHSLFGTLYLQVLFRYDVRKMAIVYLCGQAVGMFVFPFGALYDWFGPRVVVATGSVIAALGHLLFALTFGGHLETTVVNCAVFYSIMCWGCYALNVAVLPAVLSHMPRDRGQPTGLLETFSGLGSSFFSCLFRGFFSNNFENLMWFLFAVTVVVGVVGTWYLEDAPYVVNRWQQRHITLREQLRKYLIRNRYMSQLVPRRRYMLLSIVLILLNFYLTIQAVVVAYLADEMTDGKRRGIAIGAIAIILFLLILIIPIDAIDGPTEQDKQVIAAAKEKEGQLKELREECTRRARRRSSKESEAEIHNRGAEEENFADNPLTVYTGDTPKEARVGAFNEGTHAVENSRHSSKVSHHRTLSISDCSLSTDDAMQMYTTSEFPVPPPRPPRHPPTAAPHSPSLSQRHHGGLLTQHMGLPLYKPASRERSLITVDLEDAENENDEQPPGHSHSKRIHSLTPTNVRRRAHDTPQLSLSLSTSRRATTPAAATATAVLTPSAGAAQQHRTSAHVKPDASYTVHFDERGNLCVEAATNAAAAHGTTHAAKGAVEHAEEKHTTRFSYEHPHVETITLCGEVYVAPVHQTTFWESLTYIDVWLIFYVTMCVWGVGLTMVGNWNIYIMLLARYGGMQQKHYILFAAMAGVCTAGGRVFLGMYERVLQIIRERTGIVVVPTLLYPITSVGLLIGCIFWIALPGDKVLVLAYLIGPSFYGISTSMTPYVLGTIFDRDLGMHYGFCFFAGAVGFVLCYWCSWYLTYRNETSLTPRGDLCIGQRRCMNRAVGIYVALVFSSIFPAYILHRRYSKLVKGELVHRRVIVPHLMRMFRCCGCCCGGTSSTGSASNTEDDSDGIEVDETRNAAPQLYPENPPSYP